MKRKLSVVDIETVFINGTHFPSMLAIYRKNIVIFKTREYTSKGAKNIVKKTLENLLSKTRVNYVYTHNFSNFDSYFLLQGMRELGFKIMDVYTKGFSVIFVKAKYKGRMFYFRDSYLLLPLSLDGLGRLIGYNKESINLSVMNQELDLSKKYIYYLIYDVLTLYCILRKNSSFV